MISMEVMRAHELSANLFIISKNESSQGFMQNFLLKVMFPH